MAQTTIFCIPPGLGSLPNAWMIANCAGSPVITIPTEFQDVSRVQVELLIQLVGTRAHLNAVGDDSQCIYAWRGARPEVMGEEFARHFPGATRYTLSRTFRFGHRVSLAAAQLIGNNRNRMDTLCVSAPSTPDTGIEVIRATSAGDQSALVAAIDGWRRAGRSLREVAVLARLWAQTLSLELALLERDIPLVSAFATSATTEAAAEKELAYQTLLDWAVRTRTTVGEFVARMDALRRSRERYEAGGDAVLLSSIHQVKGRELPLAIITG